MTDPEIQSAIDAGLFTATPRRSRYNLTWWQDPTTGKENRRQLAMLCYNGEMALFGGQAGGGKSRLLLMLALSYFDVPGFSALICRRTWPELSKAGGLIMMAHEELASFRNSGQVVWNEARRRYTSREGGCIQFGHMEHEMDKYLYQGDQYHFVLADELTQFEQSQIEYLLTRMRRTANSEIPIWFRAAANPGGIGHEWVKDWFIVNSTGNRIFIPSAITDNPFLDQQDYINRLDKLSDPVLKKQLLAGDWDVQASGGVLDGAWFEIVEAMAVPHPAMQVMACDVAGTLKRKDGRESDETVFVTGQRDPRTGIIYLTDGEGFRGTPGTVEDRMEAAIERAEAHCKTMVVEEKPPGEAGIEREEKRLKRFAGKWYRMRGTGGKSKEERARQLSTLGQAGKVKLQRGAWNAKFKAQCNVFGQNGVHDDWIDAAALCVNTLISFKANTVVRSGTTADLMAARHLGSDSFMRGPMRITHRVS
jgi:phage terminase large subunit-like protein